MKITCLVLDDEELAIGHLLKYMDKIPYLDVVGAFTNPSEAVAFLQNRSVDLIFLDIEMPNFSIDGLDFVEIVGGRHHYIFTTAYSEYAMKSYEYNTIDYLHKPYSFERFSKAVNKARQLLNTQTESGPVDTYRYVRVEGKYQRIDFDSVCWIESDRSYVSIFTEGGRINLKLSIGDLETQLPDRLFIRIHKSYIVAKQKTDLIEANQVNVRRQHMVKTLPLGEAYRKNVLSMVEQQAIRKR